MEWGRFRTFNVADDFSREALAVEVDTSLCSQRVVRVLEQTATLRGYPDRIRFDNGPELTSIAVADWAEANGVELEFINPDARCKMVLSSALTAPIAKPCSICISLKL